MDKQDVLSIIETEKACVIRNDNGQCDRKCSACNLVLPTKLILSAYNEVIDMIKTDMEFYDPEDHDPDVEKAMMKAIEDERIFEELVYQRGKWKCK